MIHDLQPLNAVTIKDAAVPPNIEPYVENCAARALYSLGDLYVGYDHAPIAEQSRDLTTFQTPIGTLRLCSIPMGWTNAVGVFQGHMQFILQDEVDTATPFIDDVPILGPKTRYELPDGTFETILQNPEIRRFVWEHFEDLNRVLHRMKHAGATFSGRKLYIGVPKLKILGHICTYDGRIPDEAKIAKIVDWPPCENASEVRGFLGTCGVVRIFIQNVYLGRRATACHGYTQNEDNHGTNTRPNRLHIQSSCHCRCRFVEYRRRMDFISGRRSRKEKTIALWINCLERR